MFWYGQEKGTKISTLTSGCQVGRGRPNRHPRNFPDHALWSSFAGDVASAQREIPVEFASRSNQHQWNSLSEGGWHLILLNLFHSSRWRRVSSHNFAVTIGNFHLTKACHQSRSQFWRGLAKNFCLETLATGMKALRMCVTLFALDSMVRSYSDGMHSSLDAKGSYSRLWRRL